MIAIRHLSMRLTAGGRRVTILDDVTLSIPPKQMVAVMGPSGSGKSTLLGLIAGLDRPTDGAIVLDGIDITTLSESRMAKFRRIKIGYIFQSFHLIPTLTALENVLVPLELAGDAAAKDLAAELFPAANSNGLPSPERLPAARRSFLPTNRPGTWIRKPDATSWIFCCLFIEITEPHWCS
jgi:putative ABC transport system ATP-binding protein